MGLPLCGLLEQSIKQTQERKRFIVSYILLLKILDTSSTVQVEVFQLKPTGTRSVKFGLGRLVIWLYQVKHAQQKQKPPCQKVQYLKRPLAMK